MLEVINSVTLQITRLFVCVSGLVGVLALLGFLLDKALKYWLVSELKIFGEVFCYLMIKRRAKEEGIEFSEKFWTKVWDEYFRI